jgi:hypothetical protein
VVVHGRTQAADNIIAVVDGQPLSVFDGTLLAPLQALRLGELAHDASMS